VEKYNDIHLLEFGMQCVFKAMSVRARQQSSLLKSSEKRPLITSQNQRESLMSGSRAIADHKEFKVFESVRAFDAIKKIIEGESGVLSKKKPLGANGPASHALTLVPEVILRGLIG